MDLTTRHAQLMAELRDNAMRRRGIGQRLKDLETAAFTLQGRLEMLWEIDPSLMQGTAKVLGDLPTDPAVYPPPTPGAGTAGPALACCQDASCLRRYRYAQGRPLDELPACGTRMASGGITAPGPLAMVGEQPTAGQPGLIPEVGLSDSPALPDGEIPAGGMAPVLPDVAPLPPSLPFLGLTNPQTIGRREVLSNG